MSNPFISRTLLARLGDDTRRLCVHARRQHERLRSLVHAAEAARDQKGSVAETIDMAIGARRSGHHLYVRTRRLLAQIKAQDADVVQSASTASPTVLAVDDFEDSRELLAETFLRAGFVVRTATNGLEALVTAYEWHPDVIVMDLAMPVLDGIEATRLLKAGPATRNARVIAYTASPGRAEHQPPGLFVDVLAKPCSPDVLVAAVWHAASRPEDPGADSTTLSNEEPS
jgi:CheY-like chemotaxis protein